MEQKNKKPPIFKTIRQVAATGLLPEYRLRMLWKDGKLPGFMCGNRFMINVTALEEQLDAMSRASVAGGAEWNR